MHWQNHKTDKKIQGNVEEEREVEMINHRMIEMLDSNYMLVHISETIYERDSQLLPQISSKLERNKLARYEQRFKTTKLATNNFQ